MWSRRNVRSSIIGIVALAVLLLIAHGASAQSSESSHAPVVANGSSADTDFPAWDSFTDELHQLGTRIIARLPERLRNDPQVRQEAGRCFLKRWPPRRSKPSAQTAIIRSFCLLRT